MEGYLNKKISIPLAIITALIIVTIVMGITYNVSIPKKQPVNMTGTSLLEQLKNERLQNTTP